MGITRSSVESTLAGACPRPWPREVAIRVRQGFQRTVTRLIGEHSGGMPVARIRARLSRWDLSLFPRLRVLRFQRLHQQLGRAVPPRVSAAVWRTQWNGWCTERRMASLRGPRCGCIFSCPWAPDEIEHYATCPAVTAFAQRCLRLVAAPAGAPRMRDFLLLDSLPDGPLQDATILRAIRTAAVYRTHTLVRHGSVPRGAAAAEALQQCARELVRGHRRSGRALDSVNG